MTWKNKYHQKNKSSQVLEGMNSIGEYMGRTPDTIKTWVLHHDFPAMIAPSGKWMTSKLAIAMWFIAGAQAYRDRHHAELTARAREDFDTYAQRKKEVKDRQQRSYARQRKNTADGGEPDFY